MRIRWTETAASDLTQICDYIAKHGSTAVARRVALSIYERIDLLASFPERDVLAARLGLVSWHFRAYRILRSTG